MKKNYEVLVKYYEAKRINIKVEEDDKNEIDKAVKERMSNDDVGADMIIDYDYEEVEEHNPMFNEDP